MNKFLHMCKDLKFISNDLELIDERNETLIYIPIIILKSFLEFGFIIAALVIAFNLSSCVISSFISENLSSSSSKASFIN